MNAPIVNERTCPRRSNTDHADRFSTDYAQVFLPNRAHDRLFLAEAIASVLAGQAVSRTVQARSKLLAGAGCSAAALRAASIPALLSGSGATQTLISVVRSSANWIRTW